MRCQRTPMRPTGKAPTAQFKMLQALCLVLIPASVAVKVVAVATGAELQTAVNGGTLHTLITDHLDTRGLEDSACGQTYTLCVIGKTDEDTYTPTNENFDASDVVSIRGSCTSPFSGNLTAPPVPPLWPGECVVLVDRTWLWAKGVAEVWLDRLHIRLDARIASGFSYRYRGITLVYVSDLSHVWVTRVGLQGDGGQGKLVSLYDSRALFEDVHLGDMVYSWDGGVAVNADGSTLVLRNVTVRGCVSTGMLNEASKGAILSTLDRAHVMCDGCSFDAASAPGLAVSSNGSVYSGDIATQVWNLNSEALEAASPLSAIPAGLVFPKASDAELVALKQELIPVVAVATGAELQTAVNGGNLHTLITDHLDTRGLESSACSKGASLCVEVNPSDGTHKGFHASAVVSIRGNCTSPFSGNLTTPPLPPLWPRQCVVLVDRFWLVVWGGPKVWLDRLHVRVGARTGENLNLVDVNDLSQVWATRVGLQGDRGEGRLVSLWESRALIEDGYLGDMEYQDGGVAAYGHRAMLALRNVTIHGCVSTDEALEGAIMSQYDTHVLCAGCTFDAASAPGLSISYSGSVYSDDTATRVWNHNYGAFEAASPLSAITAGLVFPSSSDAELVALKQDLTSPPPAPGPKTSPDELPTSPSTPVNSPPISPPQTETDESSTSPRSGRTITLVGSSLGVAAVIVLAVGGVTLLRRRAYTATNAEAVSQDKKDQEIVPNVSVASSLSTVVPDLSKYDVFLTHEWRGADGNNHARVHRVHESLSRLGVTSWFDEDEMQGDIQARMAEGIERSSGVLVFLTKRYHDKVVGRNDQDNCKFEFDIAMNSRRGTVVVVVMEDEMLDTSNWRGKMSAIAMKLYVSLVQIDSFSDEQLDQYLETDLVPQMPWFLR